MFGWRRRAAPQAGLCFTPRTGHHLPYGKVCALLFITHCLVQVLEALAPQHVTLYSHWIMKISRRFNTGRTSRLLFSAEGTTVASQSSSYHYIYPIHMHLSVAVSKMTVILEMQVRFQIHLFTHCWHTKQIIFVIKLVFL